MEVKVGVEKEVEVETLKNSSIFTTNLDLKITRVL